MQLEKAREYVMKLLEERLSPLLCYHDINHTLTVYDKSLDIARSENVTDEHELNLLKTAALYHDCGFIHVYENHEDEGCRIAREVLPGFDYTPEEIDVICNMIMKTKLPQRPVTKLEMILCDADLDHLGRDNFHEVGDKLYKEWKAMNKHMSEREWNEVQVHFLETHHFWTDTCKEHREKKKAENLRGLKEKLYA